jgi:protoporphyrinogen oxidase
MSQKKAIIIGAGPAGLTAAFELLLRTDIVPVILEKSEYIGGISKTINYKGNRMDIGGHRFFSKSDRVMDWWMKILPLADMADSKFTINYQNKSHEVDASKYKDDKHDPDKVMLVRERLSRIYYMKQFFDYPVSLSGDTIKKLGLVKMAKIGMSYTRAMLFPIKNETNLEQFFINRFGKELYETFFKDYTEKVWGVSCKEISSEWGAQRIKKLNIRKAISHALKSKFKSKATDLSQKDTETSLIEHFLYPKLGPGQLWEEVARMIQQMGGTIIHHCNAEAIHHSGNRITGITIKNTQTNKTEEFTGDYFFSTMPVKELIRGMQPAAPQNVQEVAQGLMYRDFITVGLLLKELKVKDEKQANKRIRDNWIYIQEHEVRIGRLQIFNNWSPYMVSNPDHMWIGLEYFCNKGDKISGMPDDDFKKFAIDELDKIGIINKDDVIDSTIIREENTYPAYFGTYDRFDEVKQYVNGFENLFLTGRNGMHKYNNSDHSMLTAMTAVDNIVAGVKSKENIWLINTEQDYHEKK